MSEETLTNEEEIKALLKSQEWQAIQEIYQKQTEERLNNEDFLTPAEHKMFGSTSVGLEYHYNFPLAQVTLNDLEKINKRREERTGLEAWIRYKGGILVIPIKLLPIQADNLTNEEYLLSIEVIDKATNPETREIFEDLTIEELEKIIFDYINESIIKARNQGREKAGFKLEE